DLTVADLAVKPKGKDSNYIELKSIDVQGTRVDLAKRSVQVAKVHVAGGGVRAWRGADDSINLLELTATHANAAPPSQPAWTVSVPDISIDGFRVSAEDRKVTPAFALTLDPIDIHLAGFTTAPGATLEVDADTGVNHNGKLTAKAQISPDTGAVTAHTQLTGLDLTAFQPYITQQTSMTLLSGVLGASLAIERDKNGILSVTGDTNVTKLHTIDNDLKKDFIKWNDLRVSGIEYRSQPAKLRIKSIDTRELYARVIIAANQVLNITEVLTPPSAHSAAAHASN